MMPRTLWDWVWCGLVVVMASMLATMVWITATGEVPWSQ